MLAILTHLEINSCEIRGRVTRADNGAGIVEYLLLVLFIALVLISSLALFSGQLSTGFSRASNSIPS